MPPSQRLRSRRPHCRRRSNPAPARGAQACCVLDRIACHGSLRRAGTGRGGTGGAWSLDEERRTLSKARVGLYPIDRTHPLADGKCGFKAVLYMSRGIPPVLTPTPANAAIVRDGVEGLHADDPDAWREAIQRLLDDDDLWERCSWAAYERARSNYSLDVWGPRIASILRDLSSAAPRGDHTGPGVRHRRHADRAEPSDS